MVSKTIVEGSIPSIPAKRTKKSQTLICLRFFYVQSLNLKFMLRCLLYKYHRITSICATAPTMNTNQKAGLFNTKNIVVTIDQINPETDKNCQSFPNQIAVITSRPIKLAGIAPIKTSHILSKSIVLFNTKNNNVATNQTNPKLSKVINTYFVCTFLGNFSCFL